jgi:hypothetical protein
VSSARAREAGIARAAQQLRPRRPQHVACGGAGEHAAASRHQREDWSAARPQTRLQLQRLARRSGAPDGERAVSAGADEAQALLRVVEGAQRQHSCAAERKHGDA